MLKNEFSIVVIAKNEEKTLPNLLESVKDFNDVVLLDTGSTDKTVEIAKEAGCNVTEVGDIYVHTIDKVLADRINQRFIIDGEKKIVKEGEKYFDFASARNHAASLAKHDMVSFADADEKFSRIDREKINQLIKDGTEQFEYHFVFAHDIHGRESIKFVQSKFYDRRKMQWTGIIHEILTPISTTIKRLFLNEDVFKLEHFQNHDTNRHSYLVGLAVDCFNHPEKDRNSHYLARELLWNGRPKSAIQEFKRHIAMNKWSSERAQSMIFIGDAYGMLNEPEKQIEWLNKSLYIDNKRREAFIKIAKFYKHNNNPQAAASYAAAAMEIPWSGFYATDMADYENVPHEIMYWAKGWLGDLDGARKHILKALQYLPYHPDYLRDTKFYFDYPDQGIEGWMRFPELQFLYEMSQKMDLICEVGSWKGRSTHALLSGCKGTVTAVDHFKGSKDEQDVHKDGKTDKVYKDFIKNTKGVGKLVVNKQESLSAVKDYKDKEFNMVFIDASHTYEDVKADIRAWKNKAKILLCGHDYSDVWPGVKQAVLEEIGKPDGVVDSIWYKWMCDLPKISIIIPTLGRQKKLENLLKLIDENANYPNYEVIVRHDHFPPDNTGVPKMVKKMVGESTGDLVMYLGNDCVPKKDFLILAVLRMIKTFPEMDGLVALNDGYWHGEFSTHFLISKKLL